MNTKIYKFLVIAFPIIIILGSSIPGKSMPDSYLFRFDKVLHTIEYFLLGYLLINSITNKTHYPIILSFFLGFLFAVTDELYQSTVFGRFPSSFDIIADTMGLTLSMIFYQSIFKIIKR